MACSTSILKWIDFDWTDLIWNDLWQDLWLIRHFSYNSTKRHQWWRKFSYSCLHANLIQITDLAEDDALCVRRQRKIEHKWNHVASVKWIVRKWMDLVRLENKLHVEIIQKPLWRGHVAYNFRNRNLPISAEHYLQKFWFENIVLSIIYTNGIAQL